MVHDSGDFCNSILLLCIVPRLLTLSYLCYGVVYLCVAHLLTMIMKAENIDINSTKNEKRLVKRKFQEIRKGI